MSNGLITSLSDIIDSAKLAQVFNYNMNYYMDKDCKFPNIHWCDLAALIAKNLPIMPDISNLIEYILSDYFALNRPWFIIIDEHAMDIVDCEDIVNYPNLTKIFKTISFTKRYPPSSESNKSMPNESQSGW